MAEPQRVGPGFAPVWNAHCKVLILGSFPSPKSRAQGFYYGHPQNRFWPLMAKLVGGPQPAPEDIEAKKQLLLQNGIALWDTIQSCVITGAGDATVRDAVPNDVAALMAQCSIKAVYCNGGVSWRLYQKYLAQQTGLMAVQLPSTSPANAAWNRDRLFAAWQQALNPWLKG